MIATLAFASVLRHRTRTILAVLGVAVSTGMLLDMVMLSSGMRASFRSLLLSRGFQLRLSPKGTLPFDTEATVGHASNIMRLLAANPDVVVVSPVLGSELYLRIPSAGAKEGLSTFAIGIVPGVSGDYDVTGGRDIGADNEMVASRELLSAARLRIGDTVRVAVGYDPQLRTYTGTRALVVAGVAHFLYTPAGARVMAVRLQALQAMEGPAYADRVSLFMVKARSDSVVEPVRRWIAARVSTVSALSTESALRQVDQRLSYFRQLAFILGSISLVVGFLLVSTLVTVSVNERVGEIAVMRAIGVLRSRVVLQIIIEGAAIMIVGAVAGLGLGLATARYLNSILSTFPGLPAAIDFFLFQPRDAWAALGMAVVAGILAGVYPAWRGSSLPIAATLREEGVA